MSTRFVSFSRSKAIWVPAGSPSWCFARSSSSVCAIVVHDLELEEAGHLEQLARARAIDLAARDLHQHAVLALARDDRVRDPLDRVLDAAPQHLEHLHPCRARELPSASGRRACTRARRPRSTTGVSTPRSFAQVRTRVARRASLACDAQRARRRPLTASARHRRPWRAARSVASAGNRARCCDGGVELHAEHPVDAALQVEAEADAGIRDQRAREALLLGEAVRQRRSSSAAERSPTPREPQAQVAAHGVTSFFALARPSCGLLAALDLRAAHLDAHALALERRDSSVSTSSVTPMTLPCRPPAVTTSSPFSIALSRCFEIALALLLRPDQQEVEDQEDQQHRNQHAERRGLGRPPPGATGTAARLFIAAGPGRARFRERRWPGSGGSSAPRRAIASAPHWLMPTP